MDSWYSVRCIFEAPDQAAYEERITLWRADSMESAIESAEAEASAYEDATGFRYTRLGQACDLKSDEVVSGSAVFSLIRASSLEPED